MDDSVIHKHQRWLNGWPDGERADFSGQDLTEVDFKGVNLAGANFVGTRLTRVDLRGAKLQGADFTDAVFEDVDMGKASLTGTIFTRADMRGVTSIEETVFPFRCIVTGAEVSDEMAGLALTALCALNFERNSGEIQAKAAAVRGEAGLI